MNRVLPTLLFALAISAPAAATRSEWTPEEVRCARTVGVDLLGDTEPGSSDYFKKLAWLADLVVYGKVAKIRRDPHGPFPTNVRINVLSARKGQPPRGPLTVAQVSGPGDEPSFARGETVLLFLTKGTNLGAEPGPSDELAESSYRLVNSAKLRIDGVTATLQGSGVGKYNVVRIDYEIRQIVAAQSANCR